MPVWISKIQALAAKSPSALLFDRDSVLRQPSFPNRKFRGGNGERDMKLAIAIMRRSRLPVCIAHPRSEMADDRKPKHFLVKAGRICNIIHIKR
jgi:hypothetical protein